MGSPNRRCSSSTILLGLVRSSYVSKAQKRRCASIIHIPIFSSVICHENKNIRKRDTKLVKVFRRDKFKLVAFTLTKEPEGSLSFCLRNSKIQLKKKKKLDENFKC